jgi:ArsR family transcriptional regulator
MDGDHTKSEAEGAARFEDHARLMKALGNPWRLRILALLVDEPKHVGDLEEALGLGQAYVSQQLARLRAEGIVAGVRNGRTVRYRVVDLRVKPMLKALEGFHSA